MSRLRRSSRWIALIAAYAIALQALLPAALAAASPGSFPICSGLAAGSGENPANRSGDDGRSDCCSVMCCGPVLGTPPSPAAFVARDRIAASVAVSVLHDLALPPLRGPQAPRAPPRA
ncbi:MAG: DUF2946 family protein [Xanthobacteraceae bacterium]|uniref:DUF2946 family protein n=1 Tax=Pseudolabrys sp. TaxID=1960880 RepID=UPI003D0F237A